MLHAIGRIVDKNNWQSTLGYRIYDSRADEFIDASENSIVNAMQNGTYIKNLKLLDGCVEEDDTISHMNIVGHFTNDFIIIGIDDGICVCINSAGCKRYFTIEQLTNGNTARAFRFSNAKINRENMSVLISKPYDRDVKAKRIRTNAAIDRTNLKLDSVGSERFRILPNGAIDIWDNTIETLKIPNSCTRIISNTFNGCNRLRSVYIPDSVIIIGTSAFEYCERLVEVRMGSNVKRIGNNSFMHTGIKEMVLPNGLEHIGNKAFNNCVDLEYLVIPDTVMFIGHNALYNLRSLKKLAIPSELYYHCGDIGLEKTVGTREKFEVQLI